MPILKYALTYQYNQSVSLNLCLGMYLAAGLEHRISAGWLSSPVLLTHPLARYLLLTLLTIVTNPMVACAGRLVYKSQISGYKYTTV